jgi:hypothetical protein
MSEPTTETKTTIPARGPNDPRAGSGQLPMAVGPTTCRDFAGIAFTRRAQMGPDLSKTDQSACEALGLSI